MQDSLKSSYRFNYNNIQKDLKMAFDQYQNGLMCLEELRFVCAVESLKLLDNYQYTEEPDMPIILREFSNTRRSDSWAKVSAEDKLRIKKKCAESTDVKDYLQKKNSVQEKNYSNAIWLMRLVEMLTERKMENEIRQVNIVLAKYPSEYRRAI